MARTVHDVLTDAQAATTHQRALELLDDAFAGAKSYDLRTIAVAAGRIEGLPDAALVTLLDRLLVRAIEDREYFCIYEIASVRANRLGDPTGARAALVACRRRVEHDPDEQRGYVWVRLANEFARAGDPESAREVLAHGRDHARDADDLVDIAVAWVAHVDRTAGITLLREAEARDDDPARPWTLANAWRAIDDQAGADRVLDTALANAQAVEDALHVLSAASSHGDAPRVQVAFARAEALATTPADWLELGEAAYDRELGVEVIRRALERAEAARPDAAELDRVAAGYRVWLLDLAAAARFGERDQRPSERFEAKRELDESGSANALFDWLRERTTPEILETIASADYGHGFAKHLAALRELVERGRLPRTLGWEPHEALALTRWSDGDRVDHVARGFACIVLVIAEPDELVTNGPILLASCIALGAEPTELCAQLFAWACEIVDDWDLPVALLLLVLADPNRERATIRLLDADVSELAATAFSSMGADLWRTLISERLVPLRTSHPAIDHFLAQLLPD